MLVLTRKVQQTITVGNPVAGEAPIEITVIEVRGDSVRLGITAPRETVVDRKEIWLEKQQDKEA